MNSCQIFSCSINLLKTYILVPFILFSTCQSYCTCFWDNPVVFLYVTTLKKWWKHLRFFPILYRTVRRFKDMRGANSNRRRFNGRGFVCISHSIPIKVHTFWESHKIWKNLPLKRSIFQSLWRLDCCPDFLFIELDTSNLGYLLILLNCAKFEEGWTTFMLDILQGSPLWSFGKLQKQKTSKGDPCKMSNLNVVQSFWNFAQWNKIKK